MQDRLLRQRPDQHLPKYVMSTVQDISDDKVYMRLMMVDSDIQAEV